MTTLEFDLRGELTLDPARSQIASGGFAAVENCTWATTADALLDYGFGNYTPAYLRELDNELENLGAYAGGESWERNLRVIAALAPGLAAAAAIEYPDDVATTVREYGAQGFEVHYAGWCTTNAVWTSGDLNGGISHAGRAVFADPSSIAIWNVWTGYLVQDSDDFWRAAYDGSGLLVFHRPLSAPQPSPQEDDMPREIPGPHFPKVGPADCPLDLFNGVNTGVDRVYIRVRAHDAPATATVVLVRDAGDPITFDTITDQKTGAGEWRLPDDEVGNLILQAVSAEVSVSVKFGIR